MIKIVYFIEDLLKLRHERQIESLYLDEVTQILKRNNKDYSSLTPPYRAKIARNLDKKIKRDGRHNHNNSDNPKASHFSQSTMLNKTPMLNSGSLNCKTPTKPRRRPQGYFGDSDHYNVLKGSEFCHGISFVCFETGLWVPRHTLPFLTDENNANMSGLVPLIPVFDYPYPISSENRSYGYNSWEGNALRSDLRFCNQKLHPSKEYEYNHKKAISSSRASSGKSFHHAKSAKWQKKSSRLFSTMPKQFLKQRDDELKKPCTAITASACEMETDDQTSSTGSYSNDSLSIQIQIPSLD